MSLDPHDATGVTPWRVLLVDDEPAVHEVSRLILADVAFEGRKIELLSATSAAQAREVLARGMAVALVLLDVVMESDDAGIALVQYIRNELHDTDVQIVLRTGQPGMAPEREVIQRYEINGYFLKTDVTAQRLHSIVVSALRSYRYARSLRTTSARAVPRPTLPRPDPSNSRLATELAQARSDDAIRLQAQPEIVLASNAVAGVELVPQWKSSAGLLTAARVCELLPDGAARRRVALWMLAQACGWSRSWRVSLAAPLPVPVSIPIVGDSLGDCALLEEILTTLRAAALPKGTLDLLVTEATLLGDSPHVRDAVAALRAEGVSFTLVDFGSQTISLPRLNQLAPDRLKIHRPFVRGVANDPERMALARSVIALSQTLHIVAIADGIASDRDAQFFKWEGCDLGQGDALAPASAPGDVARSLQQGGRATH
jgi:EAL domain-containing protein (putative c-di-GMP-specific phosphodiesterase class I)/ActR/RegA family two-component response regulator